MLIKTLPSSYRAACLCCLDPGQSQQNAVNAFLVRTSNAFPYLSRSIEQCNFERKGEPAISVEEPSSYSPSIAEQPNGCDARATREKEAISVERRNARERNRVRAVNSAFTRLRLAIPSIAARNKRVSKVKILERAIRYIQELSRLVDRPL